MTEYLHWLLLANGVLPFLTMWADENWHPEHLQKLLAFWLLIGLLNLVAAGAVWS